MNNVHFAIPEIYGEALSYYEVLSKLLDKTNELRDDITNLKNNKVNKVDGKGLSTNDFTNEEKEKLSGLSNYDDSQLKSDLVNKVDFSKSQNLTAQQQTQAQSNIGIHKVTQAEYDALTDTNGIYIIMEE